MSVHLRPVLSSLPAYVPGRTVAGAIKLASNETPYPPLPHVIDRITAAAGSANRYPDSSSTALVAALADKYGVAAEQVAVGCGSVSLCTQLTQAVADADEEVVYAWRSFEAYPIITAVSGASSVQVPLRDYTHDLDAMAEAITERTRLILVCNPNNPTGETIGRDELERFLDRVPADVLVVLDEAYVEFVRDERFPDSIELSLGRSNVCVLRTFSKAYGLAGLRIGYAVADEPVAEALRACAVPFGVNLVAQAAAVASLRAQDALLERVAALVLERDRVFAELRAMDLPGRLGVEVVASQANFFWLRLGERSAAFADACEAVGVSVRPYGHDGVRVTIGEQEANDRVLQVLRSGF
jgi:histidinol-phosphate aminotransferase